MPSWIVPALSFVIQSLVFAYFVGKLKTQVDIMAEEVKKLVAARLQNTEAAGRLSAELERFEETRNKADRNHDDIVRINGELARVNSDVERHGRQIEHLQRQMGNLSVGRGTPVVLPPKDGS